MLLSGLLRYAFVAAGWLWPWLRAPLPPSRRRQTICVVQIVGLTGVAAVSPPISRRAQRRCAAVVAAVALGGAGRASFLSRTSVSAVAARSDRLQTDDSSCPSLSFFVLR